MNVSIEQAVTSISDAVAQRLNKVVSVDDRTEGYKTFSVAKGYDKRVYVQVALDLIEDSFSDLSHVVELVCEHLLRQLNQKHSHG
jgi:hypothetical protein